MSNTTKIKILEVLSSILGSPFFIEKRLFLIQTNNLWSESENVKTSKNQ